MDWTLTACCCSHGQCQPQVWKTPRRLLSDGKPGLLFASSWLPVHKLWSLPYKEDLQKTYFEVWQWCSTTPQWGDISALQPEGALSICWVPDLLQLVRELTSCIFHGTRTHLALMGGCGRCTACKHFLQTFVVFKWEQANCACTWVAAMRWST